ncbi:MAG: sugar transferase [Planctomycetota bacterium]|nr:sugar transferase [Planctomycetota bacterium]MDA1164965.1 sugar transferase [Planctomycetota bacterium]
MSAGYDYCQKHEIHFRPRWSIYRSFAKRLFDLVVCVPIVLAVAPVLLLAAGLVKLDSRGPVFFVQERLGRYGRTFLTFKFRTMTHRDREAATEILPGHSEVTRIGDWLRRFKIDELPQLMNIVNGDMSLVGPRPALPDHIGEYNEDGLKRLLERPGLTGLSQVSGNIYLSWPDRWFYDAQYIDCLSFPRDVAIIVKTIAVVLLGEERFLKKPHTSSESMSDSAIADLPTDDQRQAA